MTDPSTLVSTLLASRQPRILYEVNLRPVSGSRFQPTGFPDLGAALFKDPVTGGDRLLVESPQSMANRLESVCWSDETGALVEPLTGLPYVSVVGDVKTSSILEAHRLNSPYVLGDKGFEAAFKDHAGLGEGTVDRPKFARALLRFDPGSIVHGAFMSLIKPGTARLERMLSSFIEAENVEVVASGGVKVDRNDASGKDAGGAAEGFGNVPYHRSEYTAGRIFASFNVDLAGIRGLRLPPEGAALVVLLSLFKIRAFLDGSMRLRTACDFELADVAKARPETFELPAYDALADAVKAAIAACSKAGHLASPSVTEVTYKKKS
ncbi:MAG: type I-U CRISPR-associated protein Cas7 [Myxococcales bacterium]|nr:type I-U CRISPR-associated protein Cas7 [Myxococcales bacterium]